MIKTHGRLTKGHTSAFKLLNEYLSGTSRHRDAMGVFDGKESKQKET